MPLPKKTIRVLPNPWGFIHHELGPQGRCHEDTGGRGSDPRYIGARQCPKETVRLTQYEGKHNETRLDDWKIVFKFPMLDAALLEPDPEFKDGLELPKTPYYLDRLRDGDLIPADKATAQLDCRFKSLKDARAAGIGKFEADFGEGTFVELCPELGDKPAELPAPPAEASEVTAPAPAPTEEAPSAPPAEPETYAATPNAKRSSRNSGGSL